MKRVLCLLLLLFLLSCEQTVSVKVKGGNPPTFELSGDDKLYYFFICCESEDKPIAQENAIWELRGNTPAESIGSITYGVAPQGLSQFKPQDGIPPARLVEGKRYTYHLARGSGGGGGAFEIRDGKAVEVQ